MSISREIAEKLTDLIPHILENESIQLEHTLNVSVHVRTGPELVKRTLLAIHGSLTEALMELTSELRQIGWLQEH